MIAEVISYLTTPCLPQARRLGYLTESIAMEARYKRVAGAWKTHLERSREVILRAARLCAQRREVVVLGSGLLLDIPVEELSRQFGRVWLVDLVHLRTARSQVLRWDNVSCVEHDVAGVAAALSGKGGALPEPLPVCPCLGERTDLVVSAGLLSQLPLIPGDYVRRHYRIGETELEAWQRRVVEAHLDMLAGLPCRVCLICDVQRTHQERDGRVSRCEDALWGVPLPPSNDTWTWEIAPRGELSGGRALLNDVWAYTDFTSF